LLTAQVFQFPANGWQMAAADFQGVIRIIQNDTLMAGIVL
jgi:hypothetical protein